MLPDHPKVRRDEDGNLCARFGEYGETVELAAISGWMIEEVGLVSRHPLLMRPNETWSTPH
ncbi:MAG: hypothetical protein AB7K09_19880 [Planctomycetota bacterium]